MRRRKLSAGLRLVSRRLNRAQRRRPGIFFEGSPALQPFLEDRAKRQCVIAANRVGKSYHAAKKLAQRMIDDPGIRCRIVGPNNKMVNRVHGRYMHEFLKDYLAPGCHWNERAGFNGGNLIVLKNGSTCEMMSYEQPPDAHAGQSLHIVWLDEPPTPGIFAEAEARVFDTDGELWITLTAVGRPVRWLRDLVNAQDDPANDIGPDDPAWWSRYQVALSKRNCPWYTQKQIDARIKRVAATPWQYAQRILGAWDGVSDDRWFSAFSDELVTPLTVGATQGWPVAGAPIHLALAADYGEGAGHSVWLLIGYQVVRRDQWGTRIYARVLNEWSNPRRMSAKAEARAVAQMVADTGARLQDISWAVGDINTAGKLGAKTLNEVFEVEFAKIMKLPPNLPRIRFRAAKKGPIDTGIALANMLFDDQQLWVSERALKLTEACSHWTGKDDDLKHVSDAFRYGVVAIVDETGATPAALMAA